ncbi:TIGR03085 family metal-binding protein [Janibacter sp. DB-40]|uniref:TIGR03085 family metal-binding protein n=1 Tax=Janibacter sp. DB-40 TaxID=3028808 RepID=UPI0024055A71|nr:TIGR03085 family metal-binding protein [Janibacter sp. DB-40]
MIRHASIERAALCDTFLEVGPDAPTLCGDWTSGDLLAHLLVREGRPDASAGIYVPALAGRAEKAMAGLRTRHDHRTLVERLRQGPPAWHPTRIGAVDEKVNLVEFFVHHEDVLRAGLGAPRRSLTAEHVAALGHQLAVIGTMLFRRTPGVRVELVTARRRTRIGSGDGPVVQIHGRPGEILLFGFGRRDVAEVELIGPPEAVETVRTTDYGL